MDISFVNLLGVAAVAFAVPFLFGFFPRLRVPAVVGELIAGIILGPAVLGWIHVDDVVTVMSTLGVGFLLFLAGMELDLRVLKGAPLKLGSIAFIGSVLIGLAVCVPLGLTNFILTPLLVMIALASTSVGIVIPVLRDTGQIDTPAGRFTVAGSSVAEFGTIAMLALLFSAGASAEIEGVLLVVVGILAVGVLAGLAKFSNHPKAEAVSLRLDDTSSQVRVRLAVLLLLAAAVVAGEFGFEIILGTFLAGAILAVAVRGWKNEEGFRHKLEAMGYGFFVPCFFVASGLKFSVEGLFTVPELSRIGLFVVLLLVVRAVPALVLYRRHLSSGETRAAGLLQATNLSFIVVVTSLGVAAHEMRPITGSSLVAAGLISAVAFPAVAQKLLAREGAPPAYGPADEISDEAL